MERKREPKAAGKTSAFLSTAGLSFSFGPSASIAFPDLSLKAPGLYFLVGPNGSGKSTFLRLLSGLEGSYEGEASLFGETNPSSWADLASYVCQEPIAFEEKSVLANFLLPTGKKGLSHAEELLKAVGLAELKDEKAASLSSGERARLALAMGLYKDPLLLAVDEPFAYLDSENQKRLMDIFREEGKKRLVIVATHERPMALGGGEMKELASSPFAVIGASYPGTIERKVRAGRAYAPTLTMGVYSAIMCAFLTLSPTLPSLSYPYDGKGIGAIFELAATLYLEHAPAYEVDSEEAPLSIERQARDSGYGDDAFAYVVKADADAFSAFYRLEEGCYPSAPGEFLVPSALLDGFLREYAGRASISYEEASSSFLGVQGSLFDPGLTPVGVYETPALSSLEGFVLGRGLRSDEAAYVALSYALVLPKDEAMSSSSVYLASRESCPGGEGVAPSPVTAVGASLLSEHPTALSIPFAVRQNNPLWGRNDPLLSSHGALSFLIGSYLLALLFPLAFYFGYRNRYLALLMVGAKRGRLFARGAAVAGFFLLGAALLGLAISLAASLLPGFYLSALFETSLFMARYDALFYLAALPSIFLGFLLVLLSLRLLLPHDVMRAVRRKEE